MKKYVVKILRYPTTNDIEDMCNRMYLDSYKLASTIYNGVFLYLIFELDEIERRCN